MGSDCILRFHPLNQRWKWKNKRVVAWSVAWRKPGLNVIGSSDEVHVVDALAITGDEGRCSVRKASGSPQTGFDPEMSEWGNPPLHRWLSPREARQKSPAANCADGFRRAKRGKSLLLQTSDTDGFRRAERGKSLLLQTRQRRESCVKGYLTLNS